MTCVPRLVVLIHAPCPYLMIIRDIANGGTRSLLIAESACSNGQRDEGKVYGQGIAFSRLRRARRDILVTRAID